MDCGWGGRCSNPCRRVCAAPTPRYTTLICCKCAELSWGPRGILSGAQMMPRLILYLTPTPSWRDEILLLISRNRIVSRPIVVRALVSISASWLAIWISGSSRIRLLVPPLYEYLGAETLALFIRCKMAQDKYYKK
jgi:hypothetical protein